MYKKVDPGIRIPTTNSQSNIYYIITTELAKEIRYEYNTLQRELHVVNANRFWEL